MSRHQVVVIGAGTAGLSTAAALEGRDVNALVVDRSDEVGGSWRGRYDRLKLNSSRHTTRLPAKSGTFAKDCGVYPSREAVIAFLESYAAENHLDLRLSTNVERINRSEDGWQVSTAEGDLTSPQVVVATGHDHTPAIPDWPGRDLFRKPITHAAEYRNPKQFLRKDVLVVGPGCSGMEIAYDLADGGADRVRLAVRTTPNIVPREISFPWDLPPHVLQHLPPRLADGIMKLIRNSFFGKLDEYGLPWPEDGVFTRLRRDRKAPAILDEEVIDAIKGGRIEIVAGVESLDETGVTLAGGQRIEPDAVIAATGYERALEGMVGHLEVLDARGTPRALGPAPAARGLRFVGFLPRPGAIGYMGKEAARTARRIAAELRT